MDDVLPWHVHLPQNKEDFFLCSYYRTLPSQNTESGKRLSTVHFQASSSSRNHLTAFTSYILLYSIEQNRRGPVGFEVGSSGELAAIRLATFFSHLERLTLRLNGTYNAERTEGRKTGG
ncbi:hypothetical protein PTI98_000441 [Pleurotus ostreatus]|nr:hypothetical protein PTI98_000441 [Pleurotus ostreatus]